MDINNHVLMFDGACNLCNSSVQFILKYDTNKILKFSSLQSDFSKSVLDKFHLPTNKFDTIYLYIDGKLLSKSEAAIKIASFLPKFRFLIIFKVIPLSIRDFLYDIISKNRAKWFGVAEQCLIPKPEYKDRFL